MINVMIISIKSKQAGRIWNRGRVIGFSSVLESNIFRKLRVLNNSFSVRDLESLPEGDLKKVPWKTGSFYSLRITESCRISFGLWEENIHELSIIDYKRSLRYGKDVKYSPWRNTAGRISATFKNLCLQAFKGNRDTPDKNF